MGSGNVNVYVNGTAPEVPDPVYVYVPYPDPVPSYLSCGDG
jgi:hypothetical protein